MKKLERIAVTIALIATLLLPFLPMGWKSMAPGYILLAAAVMESFRSLGMACITVGFIVAAASVVFAFTGRWGTAGALGIVGSCVFGATALLELIYFANPVGLGLWVLLITLLAHSFLSVMWHLRKLQGA